MLRLVFVLLLVLLPQPIYACTTIYNQDGFGYSGQVCATPITDPVNMTLYGLPARQHAPRAVSLAGSGAGQDKPQFSSAATAITTGGSSIAIVCFIKTCASPGFFTTPVLCRQKKPGSTF